jgi:hypothetical protein
VSSNEFNAEGGHGQVITVRAFTLGTLVSLFIGLGVVYADNVVRGSGMALDFGSPGAFFILFLFVALLNPLLGWLRQTWYLSTAEITLIYIMALSAATVPGMGLTAFFIPYLSGAQYYATPENRWEELFMPNVPEWMVPQDLQAIHDFYEGNRHGDIAWEAWATPFGTWGPFLLVLYLVMMAMMVILRRQWMDHERLPYPLMQPSLAMVEQAKGRRLPPLFRSRLFWIGFAIPFGVGALIGLHSYYPFVPKITLYTTIPIFRGTTLLLPSLNFATVGFAYFLSRDVSLGIWLLNLIAKLQEGTFRYLGITNNETMEWVTVPILAHQNMGAMTVLVLWGLWMGRRHLRRVLRHAVRGGPREDSDEVMSYRTAAYVVVGGGGFMWWWLCQTGLPAWAAAITLFMVFVIFLGLTRMVTEGGFFITRAPMNPGNFMVSGFGVEALGTSGVTALGYTFIWAGELRIFPMAACANALKIAGQQIHGNRRFLIWAMVVAILVSVASSVWLQVLLGYSYGAINLSGNFRGLVYYPFNFISRNLLNPVGPVWEGWLWTAYGGGLMGLLMWLKQRFLWWPVHPLSLPISSMWMTDTIMLSVFISWSIKGVILKYGGAALYSRGKPFFIGLVAGQFISMGFWVTVDYFTGQTDNVVYKLIYG